MTIRTPLLLSLPISLMLVASSTASAVVLEGGNSIYRVYVHAGQSGEGFYTATTGPGHPAGNLLNVLYGDGLPDTSFNTIRSYTSGTDYVQGPDWVDASPYNPNTLLSLDPFAATVPLGSGGFRTTYTLPGPPFSPDAMTIQSDVVVHGTTFEFSSIEVRTAVTNTGPGPLVAGVRYLWDFQIGEGYLGGDDGPTFQPVSPTGPVYLNEAAFVLPLFESYQITDNDITADPPTFVIHGTVNGPASLNPTVPDLLQFVCWDQACETAFEYLVDPSLDVATLSSPCRGFAGGDTAVLYYFGPDLDRAVVLAPGETRTFSASLFLTVPVPGIPVDIKPGSCVNPVNRGSNGVIPVAFLGKADVDVMTIDPASIRLAGVPPLRWSYEDVSTPQNWRQTGSLECDGSAPDGFTDLTLKFDTQAVMAALEAVRGAPLLDGEQLVLALSGSYLPSAGGGSFSGSDVVRIIRKK